MRHTTARAVSRKGLDPCRRSCCGAGAACRAIIEANNYAASLVHLDSERFEEAKSLLRKEIPVARRTLGDSDRLTLKMRWTYSEALYADRAATLDDLREAVATLESVERVWTRVLGKAHPETPTLQSTLAAAREALAARAA